MHAQEVAEVKLNLSDSDRNHTTDISANNVYTHCNCLTLYLVEADISALGG